jgi:transposase-like protein
MKTNKHLTDEQKFEAVERICDEIAKGNPVTTTLQSFGVVSFSTFQTWLRKYPDLKLNYDEAVKQREQYLFDEMISIAYSESPKKVIKYRNGKEYETILKDSVEDRRLKINTLKWVLSKMNPNKFGERIVLEPDNRIPITSIRIIDADSGN